ncbi:hypothetical protein [Cohnella cholangitidis]|uniref:JAB domain-containing protein n=1 Tax=Cohnella cholangitidis TaxID=2598458 RepID=A0A7G5C3U5_9BACL|nr:hypothetical protein [Cohnella cholangitidis]QMV43879.1 hypothetical protein FPL14_23930 [Cohnella cholangitidis]
MNKVKEVILNNALASGLESASRMRLPYECCGVVYGTLSIGGVLTADGFSLLRNGSASPIDTFAFHPEDWISAYYDAQKNQREIVGFFTPTRRGRQFRA